VAFQLSYPNPFDAADLPAAYAKIAAMNLDFDRLTGVVVVSVWAGRAAQTAGKPPVTQVAITITPDGAGGGLAFTDVYRLASVRARDPVGTPGYDIVRRALYETLKATRSEFRDAAEA
jgi:hypothetical protein